jgi:hypothetical protein
MNGIFYLVGLIVEEIIVVLCPWALVRSVRRRAATCQGYRLGTSRPSYGLSLRQITSTAHSHIMRNARKRRLKAKLRRLKVRAEKARPPSKEREAGRQS